MPALLNRERELALVREQAIHSRSFGAPGSWPNDSADCNWRPWSASMRWSARPSWRPPVATRRNSRPSSVAFGFRGLYDREGLEDAEIRPHLTRRREAGEGIRVFPSDLPLKLASFDSRAAHH